jgi:diguanylate cyclase (GGDEF)-like protein
MAIKTVPILERQVFFSHLSSKIAECNAEDIVAVLLIDIVDFKRFNRCFGYGTGDLVLGVVHNRLCEAFENCELQRIGDNEFSLIITGINSPAYAAMATQQVLDALAEKILIGDREIKASVTIGIAFTDPEKEPSPQDLVQQAERSLFYAKKSKKSFCLDVPEEDQTFFEYLELEEDLVEAMYSGELELFYQPKIDLISNQATAAEALLRWNHPEKGYISPHVIVELSNRLGKELELCKWILNTALRELSGLSLDYPDFGIAINVPDSLIHEWEFYNLVISALNLWSVDYSRLTLEISEDAIIEGREFGLDTLSRLREQNIRISIDDFGTGYSSINYFRAIPADEIKVDQTFIGNMINNSDDHKVVELCLLIAQHFGLDVVAEGVEEERIIDALSDLNCSFAQGYCYTEPLKMAELRQWLAQDTVEVAF